MGDEATPRGVDRRGGVCYTFASTPGARFRAALMESLLSLRCGAYFELVKERTVPTINFVREGKKVQVEVGESLRYAALDNDIPLYGKMMGGAKFINCHGNLTIKILHHHIGHVDEMLCFVIGIRNAFYERK